VENSGQPHRANLSYKKAPLWQRGEGEILRYIVNNKERMDWAELYHNGIIDKSEYYRNRFKFF
jgi:hypothetical protein